MQCFETAVERAATAERIIGAKGHVIYSGERTGDNGKQILVEHKQASWTVPDMGAFCMMQYYSHQNFASGGEVVTIDHPFYLVQVTLRNHANVQAGIDIDFSRDFSNVRRA